MKKKLFTWVGILLAAAIMLPPPCLWADSETSACVTRNANCTFIQLWRSDSGRTDIDWDARLEELRKLGFEQIIVQWSIYGNVSFFDDPRKNFETASSIGALIRSAARKKIRIQLGLQYDPEFWNHIDASKNVTGYLKKRLKEVTESLDPLLAIVAQSDPSGSVVKGWYISDEIDDVNWQDANRRAALTTYLQTIRLRLAQKKEKWPVSISGFATGALLPNQWALFWKSVLSKTGIDSLLFQDGIGTEKMVLTDLAAYLSVLANTLKDSDAKLGVVVEIFNIDPSATAFKTQSAAFGRVAEQLRLADKHTQGVITVFSAPDHLIGQQSQCKLKLHRNWLEDQRECRRNPSKTSSLRRKP